MTINSINLFQALGEKVSYLNQRQAVLAKNIANSDTPNYKPQDMKEVDFSSILKNVSGVSDVKLATTSSGHLTPGGGMADPKAMKQKRVFEVAPGGNAVVIEEQIIKSNQNAMDYNLMLNLFQRNVGMLRTALGRLG